MKRERVAVVTKKNCDSGGENKKKNVYVTVLYLLAPNTIYVSTPPALSSPPQRTQRSC